MRAILSSLLLILTVTASATPQPSLTREAADAAAAKAWTEWVTENRPALATEWKAKAITADGQTMRLLARRFGEKPEKGHALFISMHGGGGGPARMNDQQWQNQIRLYEPEEGLVIAPRAPGNTWDLWHTSHIDPLFDRLIQACVAVGQVDPDRVYLMGYSAGGDGTFQLSPRMADRFAAASMMAGHPNETQPDGLRNLPFSVWMGGKDAAYKRNEMAAQWKEKLGALREADPEGYEHLVTIYPDTGHWMLRRDRDALPWMARYTRNPWPKKVVWLQDNVTHPRLYWLGVDADEASKGDRITGTVTGQEIRIETKAEKLSKVRVYLSDQLVNLDEPITVTINGQQVHKAVVPRTTEAVETSISERPDLGMAASAILILQLP